MSMQPGSGGFLPGLEPQGPDTKRLLVTFGMVTLMWIGFQYLFPSQPATTTPATPAATADAGPSGGPSTNAGNPTPATTTAPATTPTGDTIAATPDDAAPETRTIKADVAGKSKADSVSVKGGYEAELTNKGAQLSGFKLTGYADGKNKDQPIDLAHAQNAGARMLALRSRGGDVQLAADATYSIVSSDDTHVVFERITPSGVRITRTYTFDPSRFAFVDDIVLKNESASKKTAMFDLVMVGQERTGERDEGGFMSATPDALAGACRFDGKRESFTSAKVEKEAKTFVGKVQYAAIDRHFFLAAPVFADGTAERCLVSPWQMAEANKDVQHGFSIVVEQAPVDLAPGEVKTIKHDAYFGPKQVGLLQDFGHELGENINFGIFGILSRPMLWILVKLHEYTGNFGISIILLTLLMKILTFPLTQKSYVSMQKIRKFKPQIDALQKQFGHDRTLLGQKQMELYQKAGINPLAGCLPVVVQMPIWFSLYRTLSQAVELYQQPFALGIIDLTAPDHLLPFGISLLPLIVCALMLFQTWLQPPPDDQPQMKYMMWFMPIMFGFMMLQMASGLSMYMITNSLLTMAQQFYIKRKYK